MSKRSSTICANCNSFECPVFQKEELRTFYCGNRGFCERLENYDRKLSDREILFRYEKD